MFQALSSLPILLHNMEIQEESGKWQVSKWKNMQQKFSKDTGSRVSDKNKLLKDMHRGKKAGRRQEMTGQNDAGYSEIR